LRAAPEDKPAWNVPAAAAHLDARMAWWAAWPNAQRDHGTFCVSCHTALPYALARSALRKPLGETTPSPHETRMIDNVLKRVRMWRDVEPFYPDQTRGLPKSSESRGTESVLNAIVLATRDSAAGRLSDDGRLAFDNMWALQMKSGELSGAWAWLTFRLEPWEGARSSYFGAALAAIAVGSAPGGYASTPAIQEPIALLRGYITKRFDEQPLFNRVMALWASTKLPGLVDGERRTGIIRDALAKQQSDGGWSIGALGTWQRTDGTPLETGSDAYATGLVTLALQQADPASTASAPVQQGLQWLVQHQDKQTGRWSAPSLNRQRDPASDAAQFMNDVATGYAVLALTASR
jgi:hypothetical protein